MRDYTYKRGSVQISIHERLVIYTKGLSLLFPSPFDDSRLSCLLVLSNYYISEKINDTDRQYNDL